MKVFLKGLNTCVQRKHKLQQYSAFLTGNGHELVDKLDGCDAIVVWGCAFRADVRDNTLAQLRKYEQVRDSELFIAGCLPDIIPESIDGLFRAKVIRWRDDRLLMEKYFGTGQISLDDASEVFVEPAVCEDAVRYRRENPDKDACFNDQFIKLVVSEGCSNNCSYCSERLAFPSPRSFPLSDVTEACRAIVAKTGQKRVVLVADCLGEYGRDIGTNFPGLITQLSTIDPELRFALNNFNVADFIRYFDEMTAIIREGLVAHLNLPIQSASDRVLKVMNRPYSRADLERVFGLLRDLNFWEIDTHIIIGFPGETEEEFEETLEFLLYYKVKYVLASRYMEAPGMPSAMIQDKVNQDAMLRRAWAAEPRMKAAGIIWSSDYGGWVSERLSRINRDLPEFLRDGAKGC